MEEKVVNKVSEDDLEKYIEETFKTFSPGEIVKGKIVRRVGNNVLVDIGWKAEGIIPVDEFSDESEIEEGKEIMVYLESEESKEGVPVISKKKADFQLAWSTIKEKLETGEGCKARVKKRVKGGLMVEVFGLDAFLPGSQVDIKPVTNFDEYVGKEIEVKIIKVNWSKRNIVVSRRMLLEEELEKKKREFFAKAKEGDIVEGTVKNIVNFGAFIDLGGVDALLHITDISWKKIYHPAEVLKVGDRIKVKILSINKETGRITVGLKQLEAHPWEDIEKKYPIGSRVKGRVTGFTDNGAFVELEKGVEGMIHINEMSWTKNITHPAQVLRIGDVVETVVLSVDKDERKISLGLKQTMPDPWAVVDEKYKVNQIVKGVVTELRSFGAFVELEDGIEGLIKNQDLSWTKKIKHPREVLRKGQTVEAMILAIDKTNRRISLSLKHTQEDPFYKWTKSHKPGDAVKGRIIDMPSSGLVVELENELEGFVPVRELKIKGKIKDHYRLGETIDLVVKKIDERVRRIILSEKGYEKMKEEREREIFMVEKAPEKFTVKDILEKKKK